MRVYQDFFYYQNGIYQHSPILEHSKRDIYHSVKIIGWGEEYINGEHVKYWVSNKTLFIEVKFPK